MMPALIVEHWEAATLRAGGMRITFDADDEFRPAGDVIKASQDSGTGAMVLTWADGTTAWILDGGDLDVSGGLEVRWFADRLLRGAEFHRACKTAG
jgi:hypothetical protein